MFEELANEMNVEIETDKNGLYVGKCGALASICTDIILSDDETIFNMEWEEQKDIIKEKFYTIFPYMSK
jgi:hypothetical protein